MIVFILLKAPHAWNGPEPSRNCEVFIGRIPHDCFEDTLVPLFRQAGELFEFRLMINFSGWNRGYAFAMYTTEAEAGNAIRIFNNYMIRPSWQLGNTACFNNILSVILNNSMCSTLAKICDHRKSFSSC
ncbi:unnamed protein product [Leptidea sinapis]|uniref:RRM domain-containing protein n=1 Tax=Leptidea sinapis TaxID=189913 RepID=A0A5E4PNK3_9NEOP|nr:unnamed protein product [Leptidea sinapis]